MQVTDFLKEVISLPTLLAAETLLAERALLQVAVYREEFLKL